MTPGWNPALVASIMVTIHGPPGRDITGRSARSRQAEPLRPDKYLFGDLVRRRP